MAKAGTVEWFQDLIKYLNENPDDPLIKAYFDQAKGYTTTWIYRIKGMPPVFAKVEDGKMLEAREANPTDKAEFEVALDYDAFVKMVKGELSSARAGMTGKAKIKGPMTRLMKFGKAGDTLFRIMGKVPGGEL